MQRVILHAAIACGLMAFVAPAKAAEISSHPAKATSDADESWTYQTPTNSVSNARAIVQEKAEIRSAQRMDRIAALNWYGISLSRPASSPTPLTSPRLSWTDRPHQLPNAWYEAIQRPFTVRVTDDHVAQRGYPPLVH
jgi:hypothetical protein